VGHGAWGMGHGAWDCPVYLINLQSAVFVEKLMGEGISGREIDLMMKENPARLLGI